MKFREFKEKLKEIYVLLPEPKEFPTDAELKEVRKSKRIGTVRTALIDATDYYIDHNASVTSEQGIEESNDDSSIDNTLAERGPNYGIFASQAKLSQELKVVFDQHVIAYGQPELFTDSMNEATDMIFHQLARIANGDPTDSSIWHSISEYASSVNEPYHE